MRMKYILIGLCTLVIVVMGIRFMTPEDDWVCDKGQWVKHGNPSQSKPVQSCR